ncbi:MAG: aldo/keto reductase, partial [Thermomicrobiales bacterium]|nr:aldo/keto reductase [Thermomicrobiales bacterium]
ETHPYYQQLALKERIAPYGIVLESWYPLGHGDPELLGEQVFTEIGSKYGKTNAQVILRWHTQVGNIVFPRSTKPQRLAENLDIFDFTLTEEEVSGINELERGKRYFTMTLEEQEANLSGFTPAD